MYNLNALGWNAFFEKAFEPHKKKGLSAGRVVLEHRRAFRVYTESNELLAEISGRVRYDAATRAELPAVGDWVALTAYPNEKRAIIHAILPRRSKFSRKAAGRNTEEQIVAANVDTVFLVVGLDGDYNLRRVERYMVAAWESGASPVIILNKLDLCEEANQRVLDVEAVATGVPVHAISSVTGAGLDEVNQYVGRGLTVAFLGSSGVGKSTLINRLVGPAPAKAIVGRQHRPHKRLHTGYVTTRRARASRRQSLRTQAGGTVFQAQLKGQIRGCARVQGRSPASGPRRFLKGRGDGAEQRHALGGLRGRGRRRDRLFHRFAEPRGRKQFGGRRRRDVRHEAHIEAGLPRRHPQFRNHFVKHADKLPDICGTIAEVVGRPAREIAASLQRHCETSSRIAGHRNLLSASVTRPPRPAKCSATCFGEAPCADGIRSIGWCGPIDRRLGNAQRVGSAGDSAVSPRGIENTTRSATRANSP